MLAKLVLAGDIDATTATHLQRTYSAAAFAVWATNQRGMLRGPALPEEVCALQLVEQVRSLAKIANVRDVNAWYRNEDTLVRTVIERDITLIAVGNDDARWDLYYRAGGQSSVFNCPDGLDAEITPKAEAAAEYLLELLLEQP